MNGCTPNDPLSDYIIVSDVFARQFWGDSDPVGRTIEIPSQASVRRVIGVTASSNCTRPSDGPAPCIYQPKTNRLEKVLIARIFLQDGWAATIAGEVNAISTDAVVYEAKTLDESLAVPLAGQRLVSWLTGIVGSIALLLVATGIAAIVSFAVSRQQKEIGIRMALGARSQHVIGTLLADLVVLTSTSCMIDLVLALILTRMMQGQLYGIRFNHPMTYVAVGAALVVTAIVAGYIPARRAARVDPMIALRHD